eukprot:TRINITY_DN4568_c0_g2_i1.p1 TRINITY_DN4568_c0_g2~~TRINITY_DN4568_c0_g2_i1.p1  ORF type:complete len:350 (+),score=78.71 TRINITY_DN4568_c0_g2_i1:375-1424(+)
MADKGMVRADLADLNTLNATPEAASQAESVPKAGHPKLEVPNENERYPWEIEVSELMCTNLLASGAFGSVYYGVYSGEDVAVKVMNVPNQISADDLEKLKTDFKQEIAVWSKLKHPNVVQFIGASLNANKLRKPAGESGNGSGGFVIVCEYMSGGTVKSYMQKRRDKLPLKTALKMGLEVASALEYLHSLDIVHRDLKPENILMDQKGVLKIADFGVARIEATNPVDMTCETGTVRWMAPEIIDHKPYTRKVDVYSFGVVLWEFVTGGHPFRNLSFVQLAFGVVHKGLRPEIPEWVPPDLATLISSCWQDSADKRPEFKEVVQQLKAIQQELLDGKGGSGQGGCGCTIS